MKRKRYLESCPAYIPGDTQLFLVCKTHGGYGHVAGIEYDNGIFAGGAPLPSQIVQIVRARGCNVHWFKWEPSLLVEWNHVNGEPRAYAEEDVYEIPVTRAAPVEVVEVKEVERPEPIPELELGTYKQKGKPGRPSKRRN